MNKIHPHILDSIYPFVGRLTNINSIKGGDIGKAFKIITKSESYFLKIYTGNESQKMITSELEGYQLIQDSKTINMPLVISSGIVDSNSYLLLEFIESKNPNADDFERFAIKLKELHKQSGNKYGNVNDNFIGTMNQSNTSHEDWTSFYTHERIIPQLQLACGAKYFNRSKYLNDYDINVKIGALVSSPNPSIIHGDLWSGNYLFDQSGIPFLIDPSAYFGHFEVDIAMSKLFGGFDPSFYNMYYDGETQSDITHDIYQLYYLLVHLNLFGVSYLGAVTSIMNKYFLKNA